MADKFLSAGHAVAFPEIPGSSPLDYVQEIGSIIGSSHIHSYYKNGGLIKIYLTEQKYVEKVVDSGISVLGHHLQANNVKPSLLRVTLSRVDPIIPNSFLEDLLKTYGTIVSPVTHHKVSKDAGFDHIDSGVRFADLQVCNGVSIPPVIQVKYRDILCAVVTEVKEKIHSKCSWVRRSSRRYKNARNDSTVAENDFTIFEEESSNQSSLSTVESVSLSDKVVKKFPQRSLKKVIDNDKLLSVTQHIIPLTDRPSSSTCNLVEDIVEEVTEKSVLRADKSKTEESRISLAKDNSLFHGENVVIEIGTNLDLVQNKQLISSCNELSICDFSVPKSTESGYTYLREKQRLKSGKVLSELLSKDLIRINKGNSRSEREQCAIDLRFPGYEWANVSTYTKNAPCKMSQKKSVISELFSFHNTQNQINKKVTSCTLNKICDIKLSKKTNVTMESSIRRETNNRVEIEKIPSNSHLVVKTSIFNPHKKSIPKQEHHESSTLFQDTPKSSKTTRRLPEPNLLANNDFAQCSSANVSNMDQNFYQKRILQSRSSTNTNFHNLNLASTSMQNTDNSDASSVLLQGSESSKCLDFISDSCKSIPRDFNERISFVNCGSQAKSSVLRSKKFETRLAQVNTYSLPQDIEFNYVPSSLMSKKKPPLSNLNDSSKDESDGSQLTKLRSNSKKAESSVDQISICVSSQNISCDGDSSLLLNKEESQCPNLNDSPSKNRLVGSSLKSFAFNSNKSKTSMKQMLTPDLPQDISAKDIPSLLLVTEKSKCPNLDQRSSKEKSARSRPKSLAPMSKKSQTSEEMLMPIVLQDTECDDIPSLVLGEKKSQFSKLKARSKGRSVGSQMKNLQSNSRMAKPSTTLMSNPALPEDIACNDIPSLLLYEKKSGYPNLIANSSTDISLNDHPRHSQSRLMNIKKITQSKTTLALPQGIECNDVLSSHLDKEKSACSSKDISLNNQCQPKISQSSSENSKISIKQNPLPALPKDITLNDVPSLYTDKGKKCSNLNDNSIKDKSRNSDEKPFKTLLINQRKILNSISIDTVSKTHSSLPVSVLNASSNLMSKNQNLSELNANSKNSEERLFDTQFITKKNSLCPGNKDIKKGLTLDSTPILTQNVTCYEAVSSLSSNKEQAQHSNISPSLKKDSSKDSGKRPSDTDCSNEENSLPFRDKEGKIDVNLDVLPVLTCITSNDAISGKRPSDIECSDEESSLPFRDKEGKIDVNLDVLPVLTCITSNDTISRPSDIECSNEESSLLFRDKEGKRDVNFDAPPVLVCITSNDAISGKRPSDTQCSNGESSLPFRVEEDKRDVDVPPVLVCITSNDTIFSLSSNNDKPQYLDINANSTNNLEDIDKKPLYTQNANLKENASCTKNVMYNSHPSSTSILNQDVQCHGVVPNLASNKEISKHSNVLAETNTDKLVNLVPGLPNIHLQETLQFTTKLSKVDTNLNPIPVLTPNPITSPTLPILFQNTGNSECLIQNFSAGEYKSTDFDLGLSNSRCIDLNPTAILPRNVKPSDIGVGLPISQFIPDSTNCKALTISKKLSYSQSTNSQRKVSSSKQDEKAIKLNPAIALAHTVELVTPQIASIFAHHDKVDNYCKNYQYILPKSLVNTGSVLNVDQSNTKMQSTKTKKYGFGSIFHKTKSCNQNKNKKPTRKRKSKAKVSKVKLTSKMNSVQNKTCFSEYEFNSSDSDSNGISYSKWRSQNKTPQKRFRSSSVDEVNSLSSLTVNNEPYDLSFKSRKVNSTIVNNPRYDYNTLVRRKRERINAICQRVSLINKKNLSGGSFQICKNKEVVKNQTIHELSTLDNINKDYSKEQQVVEFRKAALNAHTKDSISSAPMTALTEYVSDLEYNIGALCSKSASSTEKSLETNPEECQTLESAACAPVKSHLNCKTAVKSLQKKEFKKSLSQIHAKKVRKRMKKNRVRYMCLQNDGKKIVLKKVSTASDNHRNVVDLINQSCVNVAMPQETSSFISNELDIDVVNTLGAVVDSNSVMHTDTENLDFNTCVNGFLQQLAHCNQQTTDIADCSAKSTPEFIPINLVTKTVSEVDNDLHLEDFQSSVTQNENVGLVLECQPSEAAARDCIHNFQPNNSIQCAASSTDECNPASSVHQSTLANMQCTTSGLDQSNLANLVVQKNVEYLAIELDELDGKCLNDNVVSSTHFQDYHIAEKVVVKIEDPELEDCTSSDVSCAQDAFINSDKQGDLEQSHLDLHLPGSEIADTSCVDDLKQQSLAIKIEAVYGSESANSICISELIGKVQTESESGDLTKSEHSGCVNDHLNKSPVLVNPEEVARRSESVGVSERIGNETSGDTIPHYDCSLEKDYKELLKEACSPKLQFVPGQLDKSNSDTSQFSDDDIPDLERNTVSVDQDSNQSIHVSSPTDSVVRNIFIKCEVEEDGTLPSGDSSNNAVGNKQVAITFENNQSLIPTEGVRFVQGKNTSSMIINNCLEKDLQPEVDSSLLVSTVSSDEGHSNSSLFSEIISTQGKNAEVKKEQLLLNEATNIMDVSRSCATKVLSHAKNKGIISPKSNKNNEAHNDSHTFVSTPPKRFGNCSLNKISNTGEETERLDLIDTERKKPHAQSLDVDDDPSEELPNTQGHYMIEKTEKPNTFRIYRQISVSTDHIPSTTSMSTEADESMVTSSNNLKREFIQEDEKWGPYLVKQKGQGSAKRFKRSIDKAQTTNKKFLTKKKNVLNSGLPDGIVNSNQNICDGNINSGDHRVHNPVESSNDEINTLASSTSVLEADSSNLLISNSFEDCDNAQNDKLCENNAFTTNCSPKPNEFVTQTSVSKSPCVDLSNDTLMQPCDKSAIDSVQVVPTDIYSVYRTISKKECSSGTNSVINFPLSEQCLVKFLQAAKGHTNPKKLALNVLQNNKTPGALKELIVQLYDYFKVCNDKKKKLRVSRLIMLLDNRNN